MRTSPSPVPTSFMALGDSFTEGMHDDLGPAGRHRGWADRLAERLAAATDGLRYANLAVRGRLLAEVVDEQLPVALEASPELVSFHAGGNDLLRPGRDVGELVRRYDGAVEALTGTGARVLLFTVLEHHAPPGPVTRRLASRFRRFNDGVREVASRHGAVLADIGSVPALHDRRLWHEDRLHLNAAGHERVTAAVLEALDLAALLGNDQPAGWWRRPLPPRRVPRHVAMRSHVRWSREHLGPWLWRRARGVSSGDGILPKRPTLTELAAESRRRG